MKRILCYGDSNTYGDDGRRVPIDGSHSRYDEQQRWPCRLQALLGDAWHIYEGGLNGRTTVFEDPLEAGRCGIATLDVTFKMCAPVDLVVVMLGTNDLKDMFCASAEVIVQGLERLILQLKALIANSLNPGAQILILSPANVMRAGNGSFYYDFSPRSVEKGLELPSLYAALAKKQGCLFADAGQWAQVDASDGVHLNPEGHDALARHLADLVVKYL